MPTVLQATTEQRPIVFTLFGAGLPSFPAGSATAAGLAGSIGSFLTPNVLGRITTLAPLIVSFLSQGNGILRPQELNIVRPSKGMVINTADGAFLDDFGEGVANIFMAGHTGWDNGGGLGAMKVIEQLFIQYHERRDLLRAGGLDPGIIRLWYVDTLNFEAFSVYPQEFTFERSRAHPLWVYYRMRLIGLVDLLSLAEKTLGDKLGGLNPNLRNLLPALKALTTSFVSLSSAFGV